MRDRTLVLHAEAERSGIISDLLRGRAGRLGYVLLLRNLVPAYHQLERGLEQHGDAPGVRAIAHPALPRSGALASDLDHLCGPAWRISIPLLPAAVRYADRVAEAAAGDGARLIAHAYVRYLGDLNGGQILKRLLARRMGLGPDSVAFYEFPAINDLAGFATAYRMAMDRAGQEIADANEVIEEAELAFRLNIELSSAVQSAVAEPEGTVGEVALA